MKKARKQESKKAIYACVAAILFVFAAPLASAQGLVPQCAGPNCTICDLIQLAHNVINYAIEISFVLAIAMVVYGGYNMLTSAGSEEKVTQGRKIIWYAVLGLALVLASWAIVNTVLQVIIGAKTPWPWNEIPDNCAATGISTDISGEEVRLRTRSGGGVPRSIDGILQGGDVVGGSIKGGVGAPVGGTTLEGGSTVGGKIEGGTTVGVPRSIDVIPPDREEEPFML